MLTGARSHTMHKPNSVIAILTSRTKTPCLLFPDSSHDFVARFNCAVSVSSVPQPGGITGLPSGGIQGPYPKVSHVACKRDPLVVHPAWKDAAGVRPTQHVSGSRARTTHRSSLPAVPPYQNVTVSINVTGFINPPTVNCERVEWHGFWR